MVGRLVSTRLREGTWDTTQTVAGREYLSDKLVAITPAKAALIHLLCRAIDARRVVEAGTSFGVSTIYLAAAVRDNVRAAGEPAPGGAIVIGTEHEPAKVGRARQNLAEAGLTEFTDIREGDLRETLVDPPGRSTSC